MKKRIQFFGVIINLFQVYDDSHQMLNETKLFSSLDVKRKNVFFVQHLMRIFIVLK